MFDHHESAKRLNKYSWAHVYTHNYTEKVWNEICTTCLFDIYKEVNLQPKFYTNPICGTYIFYEFFKNLNSEYQLGWGTDLIQYVNKQKTKLNDNNILKEFVGMVNSYDTWEWKNNKDDKYGIQAKQLNDFFHIIGRDSFIEYIEKELIVNVIFWIKMHYE